MLLLVKSPFQYLLSFNFRKVLLLKERGKEREGREGRKGRKEEKEERGKERKEKKGRKGGYALTQVSSKASQLSMKELTLGQDLGHLKTWAKSIQGAVICN